MSQLLAKNVVKNKFWIVENQGEKIATIQAVEDGTFVYVDTSDRKKYPSIKLLSKEHNIVFDNTVVKKERVEQKNHTVHGFPVKQKPWNILWDVRHHFPIYTKTSKSKSYYCAGYYLIKFNNGWVKSNCPKYITLNRYPFKGPFKSMAQAQEMLRELDGK